MTAHRLYYVDWSDPPYPEIRVWHYGTEWEDPVTFTEAKQEIIQRFQRQIQDAREMIQQTRSLKASDIKEEE